MEVPQDQHGDANRQHAEAEIGNKQRDRQAAEALVLEHIAQGRPRIADQRVRGGDPRQRFVNRNQRKARQACHNRDREQSCLGSESRHHQAGDGRPDDRHQRVAAGVEPVGAVPQGSGKHQREERSGAGDAHDVADGEDGDQRQQQRGRQSMVDRQDDDGRHQHRRQRVIDDHQP